MKKNRELFVYVGALICAMILAVDAKVQLFDMICGMVIGMNIIQILDKICKRKEIEKR